MRYVSRCNLEDWIANTLALVILETAMHPHEQLCGWKTGTLCSFEDLPTCLGDLSYTKAQLVQEVKRMKAGESNVKHYFPSCAKKATAIFWDHLPQHLQTRIKGSSHLLSLSLRYFFTYSFLLPSLPKRVNVRHPTNRSAGRSGRPSSVRRFTTRDYLLAC